MITAAIATSAHLANTCPGCRTRPDPCCAACGAMATHASEASASCSVSYCRRCADLVRSSRGAQPAPAIVPLAVYLRQLHTPSATPEPPQRLQASLWATLEELIA